MLCSYTEGGGKIDEKIIEELEYNSKMCKKKIKP